MSTDIKLVIAQLNFRVGDIQYNRDLIIDAYQKTLQAHQADIIVFPELALTGYPPEDLVYRDDFYAQCEQALDDICQQVTSTTLILGTIKRGNAGELFNSALIIENTKVIGQYNKQALPNHSVFDEKRYFTKGSKSLVIDIAGVPTGISICEDIWLDEYVAATVEQGAKWIININASPFHINKHKERYDVVLKHAAKHHIPVVYVNLIGGQDELVFDGASFVFDGQGRHQFQAPGFEQGLYYLEFSWDALSTKQVQIERQTIDAGLAEEERIYQALVLGVRDYINKNKFDGAVIGLSGGIDSALTLAVAVDALGAENVEAVLLPSCYTAQMSIDDALQQCTTQGVQSHLIPIESAVDVFSSMLSDVFEGYAVDTTEENIQARIRGIVLMAISNKKRRMVLTTGNKSEMAVGYATLYGDMAGGFAVLKDVSKMTVYALAAFCNRDTEVIPQRVLDRPPSAELAPDQKDTDSLPDYAVLDKILEAYVEQDLSIQEIAELGFDEQIVAKIIRMVDLNEYKRRQAAPGVRITKRAFGRDRRYPITSGFKHEKTSK